ncbi:histidine--tRNA ligase [Paenibacillus mendelii]|uniref:Histidine--tRNA ligase n=1 Tax=Paenibacillus mendelii TaxID=206163 RepID=A0ABV6J5V3_9BACL|nr:histidine--tRNA ligase [Paenibacillus mendelii]MCQ6560038.1 histidine--tRNA ligase [Paenibacillus mendelii]
MQNVKGTFDYWGSEQALRLHVRRELEGMFELYDFDAMETPILSEQELLASKYAGGDEILKEMYQLTDQGKRSLALRYDLTISFAKVVAMNPGMELPIKRYEMGKVFRDGPVKRGRLREFMQCDADVVGIEGPEAEAELMQLAVDVFRRLDIGIVIRWNNRLFLSELLVRIGVPSDRMLAVMLTLDKVAKIGIDGVSAELQQHDLSGSTRAAIVALIRQDQISCEQLVLQYGLQNSEGAKEVAALQFILDQTGLNGTCQFDPFLSRGLSFYTGTVYEIFDVTGRYHSSLGGGGRYDAIIGQLVGRGDMSYYAVGLSFGIEPIMEMLMEREEVAEERTVLLVPIGDIRSEALKAAATLRKAGIRIRIDWSRRKLKKSLATAAAKGMRFVLLLGEEEANQGCIRLKDMFESTEFVMTIEEIGHIMKQKQTKIIP